MNMFGSNNKQQSKQIEKQIETLKLQLSEKTNEILRVRDENEQLRFQLQQMEEAKSTLTLEFGREQNDNPFGKSDQPAQL